MYIYTHIVVIVVDRFSEIISINLLLLLRFSFTCMITELAIFSNLIGPCKFQKCYVMKCYFSDYLRAFKYKIKRECIKSNITSVLILIG